MGKIANIYDESQLQIEAIVRTALNQHYGEKPQPKIISTLRIKPKTLFHRKHIGGSAGAAGETRHDFFTVGQSADAPFASNFKNANNPGDQFFLIFGLQVLTAVGASAADAEDILDYSRPVDGEVLNGLLSFDVNNEEIFEDLNIGPAFINDESIPGFFRLPKIAVWEPDNNMKMQLRLADAFAAATYRYCKIVQWGIELSK